MDNLMRQAIAQSMQAEQSAFADIPETEQQINAPMSSEATSSAAAVP